MVISNNHLTGSSIPLNGIQIGRGATGTISGNTVENHTRSSPPAVGIYIYKSNGVTINDGNHIENCHYGMILEKSDGCIVSGNTFKDNVAYHLKVDNSDGNTVSANTIIGGTTGILFHDSHDSEVMKNVITDLTHEGIFLVAGSSGNKVAQNEISQVWWGISLNGANVNNVRHNKISNSTTGILFHDSHDNKVMHNELADVPFEGIFLVAGSSGNEVAQNEISQVWRGIVLIDANDNDVLKNEVADSSDAGISAWSSNGNLIKKNVVSDSGWIDLFDDSVPLANTWEDNKYQTSNF